MLNFTWIPLIQGHVLGIDRQHATPEAPSQQQCPLNLAKCHACIWNAHTVALNTNVISLICTTTCHTMVNTVAVFSVRCAQRHKKHLSIQHVFAMVTDCDSWRMKTSRLCPPPHTALKVVRINCKAITTTEQHLLACVYCVRFERHIESSYIWMTILGRRARWIWKWCLKTGREN
jgi:hypothetical protein